MANIDLAVASLSMSQLYSTSHSHDQSSAPPIICWFRQDLRLNDQPAWRAACETSLRTGQAVLPIYILDDAAAGEWAMGAASRVWLYHALKKLNESLGGHLMVFCGAAGDILLQLAQTYAATHVFWNRCYEPWRIARDEKIKESLRLQTAAKIESLNGSLLWEPWEVKKADGSYYKVFTAFYRRGCLAAPAPRAPLPAPQLPMFFSTNHGHSADQKPHKFEPCDIESLRLLPRAPRWDLGMMSTWDVGENAAHKKLQDFIDHGLAGYREGRNFPALDQTSKLSPHLHFGEISPHQIWAALADVTDEKLGPDLDCYQSELGWREFAHSLLYQFPELPASPLNKKFMRMDWVEPNQDFLARWQHGETGYPLVDAGMRELWATGYMHNRVRMVVASFLVKGLRYHWRVGEDWFWNCLVDADLANNAASWQWVAGCGADAAPYFRIFNPHLQAEKFDAKNAYINRWAPESHKIKPIIDHASSRDAALSAYKKL